MIYLVVLNVNSVTGRIYQAGDNDGFFTEGDVKHPVLLCTAIDLYNPYYVFVTREMKEDKSHQSIYLPHGSVAMILQFEEDVPSPIGFVPS